MPTNDFKRSTGYYTIHVLKATGVKPSLKDLYVRIEVKDAVQRTGIIRNASDSWDECLPIRVPNRRTVVFFTLMKKIPAFPYFRSVGGREVVMTDLIELCEGKEEAELNLYHRKRSSSRRLVIKLNFSDVKTNAGVATSNLLSLVDDDGELPLGSQILDRSESKFEQAVTQGKAIMQSNLSNVLFPQVDSFVNTIDNIVQSHPLLNTGWQLISATYKAVSDQRRLDERVSQLLQSAAFAFSFAKDASLLKEDDDRLSSIRQTIFQLMDQLIECSLFIREYVRTTFLKRLVLQAADVQKITRIEEGFKELRDNLEKGIDLQVGMYVKDLAVNFEARARDETLKEIRKAFELTPLMLREMESSNHQECMPGTREEWIDHIVSWLLSDPNVEENAFWVNGIPGSGKSTLARTIMQHPKIKAFLVSHIFFKRENTRRHEILNLIAYRLATSNAAVATAIAARLNRPIPGPREFFKTLIQEPLKEAEAAGALTEPVVVILDALDEYGSSETRATFVQLLSSDFADLPRCVRFLVTSRPEADLVEALSQKKHIQEAKLEIDTEESRRDVSLYIATQMKELVPAKAASGPKWEEMMTIFGKAADGLFIWASVAVELVRSADRRYKKLCALAYNEERLTLDDLYRNALSASGVNWKNEDSRKDFAMLFTLILPNRGSLTVDLFDLLFLFEGDTSESFLVKFQSFLSYGRFKSVQIHHKTFTDFITSPKRTPKEPWFIDLPKWNNFVARHCFLAMKDLHYDMCGAVTGSGDGEVGINDIQPHIIYASLYWADHLKDAEFSLEALELLREFLQKNLLFWFEALSLLKEFSRVAQQALSNAIDWVSEYSTSTTSFLMDARSIVSRFPGSISKSPAFIYATALPLTLSSNSVSQQYRELSMGLVSIGKPSIDLDADEVSSLGTDSGVFEFTKDHQLILFSSDIRNIISCSARSEIIWIWNAHTGERIRRLKVHTGFVNDIVISPEGNIVASASDDETIRLWDIETGKPICEPLRGHKGRVTCVAFSPNGKNIASGSDDCTIRMWSAETGQPIGKPYTAEGGPGRWVRCLAYSPDGKRLVSGSHDGVIIIWDVARCIPVKSLGLGSTVRSFTFPSNEKQAAAGSEAEVQIWNALMKLVDEPPPVARNEAKRVNKVTFSLDGDCVIYSTGKGSVYIWDVENQEQVMPHLQHDILSFAAPFRVAYSRCGSRIISAMEYSTIIWNSLTGEPIIGTGVPANPIISENIEEDQSPFHPDKYLLFEGWTFENGGLRNASGEYRILLPQYMRKFIHEVDQGIYVHHLLHLNLCNAGDKDQNGFMLLL